MERFDPQKNPLFRSMRKSNALTQGRITALCAAGDATAVYDRADPVDLERARTLIEAATQGGYVAFYDEEAGEKSGIVKELSADDPGVLLVPMIAGGRE